MLEGISDQAKGLINGRERSGEHILEGLALCVGAVLVSAAIAGKSAPTKDNPKRRRQTAMLEKPAFQPPKSAFAAIWPPLFMMLTLSGVRIWNAPPSPARSRAMGLWGLVQALNAVTTVWGPKQQSATLASHLATLGGALAYVNEARKVDPPAAAVVSPYIGWMSFAGILTEEVWRKNKDRPTVH